ncbi:MAG: segregation and condensation protein A [Bacilli bacterium]
MYKIKFDDFEGPLDLLLHLIKKNDMNIYDVNISIITEDYLDYIKQLETLNLTIESQYIVFASDLIHIKSETLLPNEIIEEDFSSEFDTEEDLINRLIEYKKYKETIPYFRNFESNRFNFFTKEPENISQFENHKELEKDYTIDNFIKIFEEFLSRKQDEKPLQTKITKKELSISTQIINIRKNLIKNKKLNFHKLFNNQDKPLIIVSFLAILTMLKNNEIIINQCNNFEDIEIQIKEAK